MMEMKTMSIMEKVYAVECDYNSIKLNCEHDKKSSKQQIFKLWNSISL